MSSETIVSIDDLQKYWRPLDDSEEERAETLISFAEARLSVMADDQGIDISDRLDDDNYKTVYKWVVIEAVKRAMSTPVDAMPVDSYSMTAGPYSENYKYTNPSGDLWFKKTELSSLGLGKQRLKSIAPNNRYDIYMEDNDV